MTQPDARTEPQDLVALIAKAGTLDLERINQRIDTLTREIREYVTTRKQEMRSLTLVQHVLEKRLGQARPRQHRKPLGKNGQGTELQNAVYDLLAKEGSMPLPAIAARMQRTPQGIAAMIGMCDWFRRENGEVHIAIKQETE